jgi:hypothetical protein
MASARQIVLIPASADADNGATLGPKDQFLDAIAQYNTAPDTSPETMGVAFGPGFRLELPFVADSDPINQALITVTEEDNAWPVLFRMCRENDWRLLDPESGRTFGM